MCRHAQLTSTGVNFCVKYDWRFHVKDTTPDTQAEEDALKARIGWDHTKVAASHTYHLPTDARRKLVCFHCGLSKERTEIRNCSGCLAASFCSEKCRLNGWPAHKAACRRSQAAKKLLEAAAGAS